MSQERWPHDGEKEAVPDLNGWYLPFQAVLQKKHPEQPEIDRHAPDPKAQESRRRKRD